MIGALDFYFTSFRRRRRFFYLHHRKTGFRFFFFHLLCLFVCLAFIAEILLTTQNFLRDRDFTLFIFLHFGAILLSFI